MKTETYWNITRILGTVGILSQGLYYSFTQPGPMDMFNAVVGGIAIYAIWFAREKKAPEQQ